MGSKLSDGSICGQLSFDVEALWSSTSFFPQSNVFQVCPLVNNWPAHETFFHLVIDVDARSQKRRRAIRFSRILNFLQRDFEFFRNFMLHRRWKHVDVLKCKQLGQHPDAALVGRENSEWMISLRCAALIDGALDASSQIDILRGRIQLYLAHFHGLYSPISLHRSGQSLSFRTPF